MPATNCPFATVPDIMPATDGSIAGLRMGKMKCVGLYYRVPLAGFLAWFIFIGPGVAEFSWTERSFLMVFAFIGPTLYMLTAL